MSSWYDIDKLKYISTYDSKGVLLEECCTMLKQAFVPAFIFHCSLQAKVLQEAWSRYRLLYDAEE